MEKSFGATYIESDSDSCTERSSKDTASSEEVCRSKRRSHDDNVCHEDQLHVRGEPERLETYKRSSSILLATSTIVASGRV